jgi:hypothetical protein
MDLATREAGTEFADIVCADPDLLRQEFDALIAASYARPPASRPPAPPGTAPRHGRPQPPAGPGSSRHPGTRTAPRPGHGHSRQRSPPP